MLYICNTHNNDNQLTASNGATLTYDGVGRLATVTKAGVTTRFVYDGNDLIAEFDSAGNYLRRYVHGSGMDEALVWLEGSGNSDRHWLLSDERGSIVGVTNGSGAVTVVNTYAEYGQPGSTNQGRFQYTGCRHESAHGVRFDRTLDERWRIGSKGLSA